MLLTKFAATVSLFGYAAHTVRSNRVIVVANYVSDKNVGLLTKFAATGSLF